MFNACTRDNPPSDPLAGKSDQERRRIVATFFRVRRAVGLLGAALPVVVWAKWIIVETTLGPGTCGSDELPTSVSAYYHTCSRDLFVGILCTIAVFLFAYRGYGRKPGEFLSDEVVAIVAGLCALNVAFFPAARAHEDVWGTANIVHYTSAAVMFTCLILFSVVIFTRGRPEDKMSPHGVSGSPRWPVSFELAVKRVYVGCGVAMTAAILFIVVYEVWFDGVAGWDRLRPVFTGELVALISFGVSWIVKGAWLRCLVSGISRAAPRWWGDEKMTQVLNSWRASSDQD
ncbi:MAG: hypothetical protein B7733_15550 [Myxococcales bacterium FL481]|nr:MAG: hypothetical protein B7733_15550 [Myxococcales bacterium FL481]